MSDYRDYLDSPEWWQLRKLALARAEYQCEQCGAHELLNVHHLTYEQLGAEPLDDLEVLCPACHREAHKVRNRRKRQVEHYGQVRLFPRWKEPGEGGAPAHPMV